MASPAWRSSGWPSRRSLPAGPGCACGRQVVSAPAEVAGPYGTARSQAAPRPILRQPVPPGPAGRRSRELCLSVPGIDLRAMNDLGLVSVLSWQTWLAFGLLTLGPIVCGGAPTRRPGCFWCTSAADGHAVRAPRNRLPRAKRAHSVPARGYHRRPHPDQDRLPESTLISAGPVFYGTGQAGQARGRNQRVSFATWAPVAFNLLYLPPLLLVARALTRDPRLMLGTVWVVERGRLDRPGLPGTRCLWLYPLCDHPGPAADLPPAARDRPRPRWTALRRFRGLLGCAWPSPRCTSPAAQSRGR